MLSSAVAGVVMHVLLTACNGDGKGVILGRPAGAQFVQGGSSHPVYPV